MNQLNDAKRAEVVRCLVEGCSIRSTVRITGVAKNTIAKLTLELGDACLKYHDEKVRNLKSSRIQCDEIWQFVYSKEKNIPEERRGQFGYGDVWIWSAIDADSKFMISWHIGMRTPEDGRMFMSDLASRLSTRVQITSDGLATYRKIVRDAFGDEVDFAQLVKEYGDDPSWEKRYSPAIVTSITKTPVSGDPSLEHVSTSFVERNNLTMRMGMRRFTRLTNGFSKKIENHSAAIALHMFYTNFCRPHQTLTQKSGPARMRTLTTPAMAIGLSDRPWALEEIVSLL